MEGISKNIDNYNANKKRKIFIVFDDSTTYMLSNKKRNPLVTDLFIRGRKVFFCFYYRILCSCSKNIRLNSTQ